MRKLLVLVGGVGLAVTAAACSGGGGGGGGGGTLSSGNYATSNAAYSKDQCGAASQNPASNYDGQTLVVTTAAGGVSIDGETFSGSGSNFAAATQSTNFSLSSLGLDCVLGVSQSASIHVPSNDLFHQKLVLDLSVVSGTQCSTAGTFPCQSIIEFDATKQ